MTDCLKKFLTLSIPRHGYVATHSDRSSQMTISRSSASSQSGGRTSDSKREVESRPYRFLSQEKGTFSKHSNPSSPPTSTHTVIRVATAMIPKPHPLTPWEDIFNFRSEVHIKEWEFRRFLIDLATKRRTEAEIKDDLEWTLHQYTKAMERHRIKSANGWFETYVIPTMELVENITKFNWSKLAKGALSVKKRQLELMEAEGKLEGRQCAYIFDANKRFGNKPSADET